MASASKPAPAKQLKEHLQDQQEPFTLNNFLSERRYMKSLGSKDCPIDSAKNLKGSYNNDLNKRRKGIFYATKILASVIYKLIPTNNSRELSNRKRGHKDEDTSENIIRETRQTTETNRFFSINCLNTFGSTDSNVEEYSMPNKRNHGFTHASTSLTFKVGALEEIETAADAKLQWISMEADMQLSAASLLRDAPSNKVCNFKTREATSSYTSIPCKKNTGGSIISASLWELLINSPTEKKSHVSFTQLQGIIGTGSSLFMRNKRLLPQRKQLLFDCVKKALETHGKKGKRHEYTRDVSEPEDMEKIIFEQICSRGKQSGLFDDVNHLMNLDISRTLEEWSDFQQPKRKIGMEIGDAIMDEIVKEMIDLFLQQTMSY